MVVRSSFTTAPLSRRTFLTAASAAAAASLVARHDAGAETSVPMATGHHGHVLVPSAGRWSDPDLHALTQRAVEAAMAAGAQYADARITLLLREQWFPFPPPSAPFQLTELHGVGVRALHNGFWGFFSSTVWTPEEMVRLGQGAVAQAISNARGKTRDVSLGTIPQVTNGSWVMPVKYDPFTIPFAEKADFLDEVMAAAQRYSPLTGGAIVPSFQRLQKYFASSEGSSWTQTTYLTEAGMSVGYRDQPGYNKYSPGTMQATTLSPAGRGWEYIAESGLIEQIPAMADFAQQMRESVPVDVGRYDLVLSAQAVATLVSESIGTATELDRALGYEANADGTSYVDQPLEMLGTYHMGSSLLTVSANRSQPGGAATVKWDDEAVEPEAFTLVKDGVLVDYQTTREQAQWLAPYYQKSGTPVRSHGCASTDSALDVTLQNAPNLQMHPGTHETSFDDLVAGIDKGIAIYNLRLDMDAQQLNGTGTGLFREITKGKLGRLIVGAAVDFRAPELWKTLAGVGGAATTQWFGIKTHKGEPTQQNCHSVGAVPAKFTNTAIIDFTRKA